MAVVRAVNLVIHSDYRIVTTESESTFNSVDREYLMSLLISLTVSRASLKIGICLRHLADKGLGSEQSSVLVELLGFLSVSG